MSDTASEPTAGKSSNTQKLDVLLLEGYAEVR